MSGDTAPVAGAQMAAEQSNGTGAAGNMGAALAAGAVFPAQDAAGQTVAAIAQADTISADEIALYDRQIRLWGVQAQEKIRTANILLVSIKALANEVAKNLVLAGVASITLADHEAVTEDDLGAQFLVSEADVRKNRAEAAAPALRNLNPRVAVHTITRDIRHETDITFYQKYDIIIATDLDFLSLSALDSGARLAHRPFYAAAAHGMYGFIFADLGSHDFVVEREKSNLPTRLGPETGTRSVVGTATKPEKVDGKVVELVTKREVYTPLLLANTAPLPKEWQKSRRLRRVTPLLTCVRALWEYQRNLPSLASNASAAAQPAPPLLPTMNDIRPFTALATSKHAELLLPADTLPAAYLASFLRNLGAELAPVTAFLGGQLAQDVINVLGRREQPIQNLLLFDAESGRSDVLAMHPIFGDEHVVGEAAQAAQAQQGAEIILD